MRLSWWSHWWWSALIANQAASKKTIEEARSGAHIVMLVLDDLQKMIK